MLRAPGLACYEGGCGIRSNRPYPKAEVKSWLSAKARGKTGFLLHSYFSPFIYSWRGTVGTCLIDSREANSNLDGSKSVFSL